MTREEIIKAALEMPDADRAHIAANLLESLPAAQLYAEEWGEEIKNRIARHEKNPLEAIPGDEAMDRLRKAIRQRGEELQIQSGGA